MYQTYEMETLCPGCNERHTLGYEGTEPNSLDLVIYKCPATEKYFRVRGLFAWCEEQSMPERAIKLINIRDIEI